MIRNSIVAGATAVVVAFAIWFQASATASHEVKDGERSGGETSYVEPTPAPDGDGETGPDADSDQSSDVAPAPAPGEGGDETKDESPSQEHSGKPGEVKP